MLRSFFATTCCIAMLSSAATAGDFAFSFSWAGLKSCTSGNPNTVSNPRFVLKDVPDGTKFIRFRLTDKNVPGYNHGGGVVPWSGGAAIEPGAFKYKSPCPPGGAHVYEWKATAQTKRNGGVIATAKASRKYPE